MKKLLLLMVTIGCTAQIVAEAREERREERHEHAKEGVENTGRALALPFTATADLLTGDKDHYTRQNLNAMSENHERVHHHHRSGKSTTASNKKTVTSKNTQ